MTWAMVSTVTTLIIIGVGALIAVAMWVIAHAEDDPDDDAVDAAMRDRARRSALDEEGGDERVPVARGHPHRRRGADCGVCRAVQTGEVLT